MFWDDSKIKQYIVYLFIFLYMEPDGQTPVGGSHELCNFMHIKILMYCRENKTITNCTLMMLHFSLMDKLHGELAIALR